MRYENPFPIGQGSGVDVTFADPSDAYGNNFGPVEFTFVGGLSYPDVIELNFSLTVDPQSEKNFKIGAGSCGFGGYILYPMINLFSFAGLIQEQWCSSPCAPAPLSMAFPVTPWSQRGILWPCKLPWVFQVCPSYIKVE